LLPNNVPTNAPSSGQLAKYCEPVAVQQRVTEGTRKLIFWYLAEVDSTASPTAGTQGEGEDFETRWISMKDAAASLSFEDDRTITAYALQAFTST